MEHYVLKGREIVPATLMEWGAMLEDPDSKRVAETITAKGDRISTVFLGIDHGLGGNEKPVLFETMVFKNGSGSEIYQERYCTYEEAEDGHKRACDKFDPESVADADLMLKLYKEIEPFVKWF